MQRALLLLVVVAFIPRAAAAQGEPLGPEFRVNTYTTDYQVRPALAWDASGNFVVVWSGAGAGDPSPGGVFGQRYARTGAPLGPQFRVNTFTTSSQGDPAVASDSSGNFVVVWYGYGYGQASSQDVFAQRFANTSAPLGSEFRVNTYTIGFQGHSSVASDSSGNFVVVWHGGGGDVYGQRYASTGVPLGPEFRVNTYTTNGQCCAAVASNSSSNFVVVWASFTQDGDSGGVFGQRYASTGAPLGPEFRINTYTTDTQVDPAVAWDASGNFVVVWGSDAQDEPGRGGSGVFGQRYASTGAPLGPEFRVNTYTTLSQQVAAVATDSSGNFLVVWESRWQDGSYWGVFGQRYSQILPVELMHFRVE